MAEKKSQGGFIGLWIIEKLSGIPICSIELNEENSQIDSVLFGGFLVAIRGMSQDFEIGQLNSFQTDLANLLITGSENILSVLAIEKDSTNPDFWYSALVKIHEESERFYNNYRKNKDLIDTSIFEKLKPNFIELIIDRINNIENNPVEKPQKPSKDKKTKNAAKKLEDSGLW